MSKPVISIVMTYYNRPQQLLLTLRTIEYYCKNLSGVEVIIVDDGSDEEFCARRVLNKVDIGMELRVIETKDKWWTNPCIPFNIGFNSARGDIVCIQNAESLHCCGNLIKYALENTNDKRYLTFSCYSTQEENHNQFGSFVELRDQVLLHRIEAALKPFEVKRWFNHSEHLPTKYHYFSSITKKNLDKLGGFNKEFATGLGFEDDEFLFQVEEAGLEVVLVPPEVGVIVHQWHPKSSSLLPGGSEWKKNKAIYLRIVDGKRIPWEDRL